MAIRSKNCAFGRNVWPDSDIRYQTRRNEAPRSLTLRTLVELGHPFQPDLAEVVEDAAGKETAAVVDVLREATGIVEDGHVVLHVDQLSRLLVNDLRDGSGAVGGPDIPPSTPSRKFCSNSA